MSLQRTLASTRLRATSVLCLALCFTAAAVAQTSGPSWQQLSPQQRAELAPLERDWSAIDAGRKQKWIEIAGRLPAMSPDERQRIQGRMADWSRLSANERSNARQSYQDSRNVGAQERQQRWEAYQALPPERRRELAQGARPPRTEAPVNGARPQQKSNIVPNPIYAAPPKTVAPNVVQARPGATTTLISRPPAPPPHQQTGLPKIAATPGFVDRSTLLPQRGPQGAATRPANPAPSAPPAPSRER